MKTISLKFFNSELFYDIQNITHIVAVNRVQGDEAKYNIQISESPEQFNFAVRSITEHWGDVVDALRRYIKDDTVFSNNILEEQAPDYNVTLELPDKFNEATTKSINNKVHDYIVYATLYDWFMVTMPEIAGGYKMQAEEAMDYLKSKLTTRTGFYTYDSFPKYR